MPNRLAGETSPYLLQHAHNPVDWYPWGPEALARAKAEDKPVERSRRPPFVYGRHRRFERCLTALPRQVARAAHAEKQPRSLERAFGPELDCLFVESRCGRIRVERFGSAECEQIADDVRDQECNPDQPRHRHHDFFSDSRPVKANRSIHSEL